MDLIGNLFGLSGKVALVTGGSSGLGLMIARGFALAGADVMICARKKAPLQEAVDDLNEGFETPRVIGFVGDVSSEDGINAIVKEVETHKGHLDILVNNAGITWSGNLGQFPYSAWEKVMNVNVAGLFTLTQSLLPMLRAGATHDDPARVVNLGSVMGSSPLADGVYSYSASKAAVHHLTKILAKELAKDQITVNALAPGPFPSKMTNFAVGTEEKATAVGSEIPLGRLGKPSDIQAAALYLCAASGAYITGSVMPVDGGIHVATGPELFAAGRDL